MEFWKTRAFKKVNQLWYKKLEKTGFIDAEKKHIANSLDKLSEFERQSRYDYFSCMGFLANNTSFSDELEEFIMTRYADGATITEIGEELKRKRNSRDRETIRFIIRRWQNQWGIKSWSLKEMNLKLHTK